MTKRQAIKRAKRLNATRYRQSRIKVKPFQYGKTWVLIGV